MERTTEIIRMKKDTKRNHTLIAGLGNLLLKDDGVGVHAVYLLQQEPPLGALAVEIGTAILSSLHLLEWADRILVIDAVKAGGKPGTVYTFGGQDVDGEGRRTSLHQLSLVGALRLIPAQHKPEIIVLGVEPAVIDYGMELSPEVNGAMPQVIRVAREIVSTWNAATKPLDMMEQLARNLGASAQNDQLQPYTGCH